MLESSPINSNEASTEENQKYWRLEDVLPSLDERIRCSSCFKLQNQIWSYSTHLSHDRFQVILCCLSSDVGDQFNLMAGIFGESGEEIAVVEGQRMSRCMYAFDELISYSKLRSLVESNELLIFFLEIKRKDEEKAQKTKVLKRKYQADFEEMFLSGIKHDLTINVKHRKFHSHANILSARSPVFYAMLEHEMKEKCTGEVFIKGSEPDTFEEFLLYLYTGNDEHLNWENVTELYKLGDKYCVEDLKCVCVEHMKSNMLTKNFFEIFLLSQQHSDSELSEAAIEFFLQNSKHIESEAWYEFLKRNPEEAYILVKAL